MKFLETCNVLFVNLILFSACRFNIIIVKYDKLRPTDKPLITEFSFVVAIVTLKPRLVKGLFHAFVSCHTFDLG